MLTHQPHRALSQLLVDLLRHHAILPDSQAGGINPYRPSGNRWQHAPTLTVPVNRTGFERISALVHRLSDDPGRDVTAGLEPTGGYYARTVHAFLRSLGLPVHWVKNNAVHDARDAVYGKKTKTDPLT